MRKIYSILALTGLVLVAGLNMGQSQAPVAARMFYAATPTGTTTPGVAPIWLPYGGSPAGSSSSGSTVIQGTNPWTIANASPTPQIQVNDPVGNTNWGTYLTPLAYTATPTATPNAAADNYQRIVDLAVHTPVFGMNSKSVTINTGAINYVSTPNPNFSISYKYPTYYGMAHFSGGGATVMASLQGSSSATIYVSKVMFSSEAASNASPNVILARCSAAPTPGGTTPVTISVAQADTSDAAPTALMRQWGNSGSGAIPGGAVTTFFESVYDRWAPGQFVDRVVWTPSNSNFKEFVLRSSSETLVVLDSSADSGTKDVYFEWSER